jgi:hypothetical protein
LIIFAVHKIGIVEVESSDTETIGSLTNFLKALTTLSTGWGFLFLLMAKDKKSFLLYCDTIHTVDKLSNEKAGELFKHILAYVNDMNPTTNDFIIELAFEPIKQSLKRDLIKYEDKRLKNKENAYKRWHTDDATVSDGMRMDANDAVSDSVSDSVIDIKFDFKKSLIELGVEPKLILEWLKVRKFKGGINTETAFNRFVNQVKKSGASYNDAVKMCVEKSWTGFEADWYEKNKPQEPKKEKLIIW